MGTTLSTAATFRMQIEKKSGNTPETLSEQILEFLASERLEVPQALESTGDLTPRVFPDLCLLIFTGGPVR